MALSMSQTIPASDAAATLRHPVAKGWLVHCVTSLGAVCGMFGIITVADGKPRLAILWLAVAMVLDGIDGPVARAWNVRENVPRIDGYTLDLVVDYVTCIVVPVIFLHKFEMLPPGWSLVIGAIVLFTSALWMSRTDQTTPDHFFNGFPGEWNMIIPTLYLLNLNHWFNLAVCVAFIGFTLSRVQFPHPVSVRERRPVSIAFMVAWVGSMLWLAIAQHNVQSVRIILCAAPLWTLYQVAKRVRVRLRAGDALNDGGWPDLHRTAARAARAR